MRAREGREVGPADQVERWAIDRLIAYAKNSRTHSEAQIAQLAASMKEWGWTNPVLADEAGGVIAGHARILAARQLGYGTAGSTAHRGHGRRRHGIRNRCGTRERGYRAARQRPGPFRRHGRDRQAHPHIGGSTRFLV